MIDYNMQDLSKTGRVQRRAGIAVEVDGFPILMVPGHVMETHGNSETRFATSGAFENRHEYACVLTEPSSSLQMAPNPR